VPGVTEKPIRTTDAVNGYIRSSQASLDLKADRFAAKHDCWWVHFSLRRVRVKGHWRRVPGPRPQSAWTSPASAKLD
jgi:hypothetical protein